MAQILLKPFMYLEKINNIAAEEIAEEETTEDDVPVNDIWRHSG